MIDNSYAFWLIMVVAAVTMMTRFLPFIIFRKHTPEAVLYLSKVLPYAIMGMLVVYCLKGTNFLNGSHGLPEMVSVVAVVLLHKWKHNTLLSILIGTILYMLLIQFIF